MTEEREPHIGLWGPTHAGKTAYLAALYRRITGFESNWTITASDRDARDFVRVHVENLDYGILPNATQGRVFPYHFDIRRRPAAGMRPHSYQLTIVDAPGAYIADYADEEGYFSQIRESTGLLCLLDPDVVAVRGIKHPAQLDKTYIALLEELIAQLSEAGTDDAGKVLANLAFCVTKVDLDHLWPYRERAEDLAGAVIGPRAHQLILNRCDPDRLAFFTISTVGRYTTPRKQERPNIEPAGEGFRISDLEQWEPYQLRKPLEWLLDRVEAEREAGRIAIARGISQARRSATEMLTRGKYD